MIVILEFIKRGQAIDAVAVGKIVASGSPKYGKDDLVLGVFTWAEYSLVKEGAIINKLEPSGFPLTYHLGVLGNYVLIIILNASPNVDLSSVMMFAFCIFFLFLPLVVLFMSLRWKQVFIIINEGWVDIFLIFHNQISTGVVIRHLPLN